MNKFIIMIFLILNSSIVMSSEIDKRRDEILKIISEELIEVQKLDKQARGLNPDLQLQIAELNLEKARLYREKENQDYLKIPTKKRSRVNKAKFFSQSNKYYREANNIGIRITKKYKNYKRLGEVYYILGFNAKEANNAKVASKYLALASRKSGDSKTKVKAQISLAEVYYNEKNYRKAIPLYESALSQHTDKWWTKDAFNLAWSYFRENRYGPAISKLQEVYAKSRDKRFIDMSDQVERDIGLFYATSGRIDEGIKFYKNLKIDFTDHLLKIANNLNEQGQYTRAEGVLQQALKFEKDEKKEISIKIELLVLYEKFGKYSSHQKVSADLYRKFLEKKINSDQLTTLKYQFAKVAAILQKQVVSNTYVKLRKTREAKARQAIIYFGYLSVLEPSKTDEYLYLKAETAFACKLNSDAYVYYRETFEYSENNKAPKFKMKSMEGMLAILSLNRKDDLKQNIYVFEKYIANWPNDKSAKDIYQRLFTSYMSINEYEKAKRTLNTFVKYYPKDIVQEAMIAKLMDQKRKEKDDKEIRVWIAQIDAGKYFVSNKYKIKLQELLTTMQIEDVQTNLSKGNKKVALIGYHQILEDKYSTKRSKINAKYNLAALYFELGDTDNAYKWSMSSINEMGVKDVYKFSSAFVSISNFLFSSLEFDMSAKLAEEFFDKICKVKTKKKQIAFKNAAFIYLANRDITSTQRLINKGSACKISRDLISEIEYEILKEYGMKKDWQNFEKYLYKLSSVKSLSHKIIDEFILYIEINERYKNSEKVKQLSAIAWKLYYSAKKNRESITLSSLDYFADSLIEKMNATASSIRSIEFAFPEKVFAIRQKEKLSQLTKITEQANDVQSVGSGRGIAYSYKLLNEIYKEVADDIYKFEPAGKSPEYIKQFKKDFNNVGDQINAASKQYYAEAVKAIHNNKILSDVNGYFQPNKVEVEYDDSARYYLMDRSGN